MKKAGLKCGKLLAALVLMVSLVACSKPAEPKTEGAYKAGTYSATEKGNNGDVTVEVTFTNDKIEKVEIKEHKETAGISDAPIAYIPTAIVDGQTLNVETVTGATNTSNAILAAVAACVSQAGGDVEALKTAGGNKEVVKEEKEMNADLIIVGGGAAGMVACIRAQELGLNVILVEKMSFMGGAVSISGGNQVVMGSELQKQAGVTEDTAQSMVDDFMKNGANLNVPELISLYAENVGSTSDWMQANGITFNMEGGLHKLAEYSFNRELAYTGGGSGAATAMRDAIAKTDAQVLLNTQAQSLIQDENGVIIGVKASDDKTNYTLQAKAVLMATGGYGNNKDLLNDEMKTALYYGPASSTGDGIIMATAEGIDAATRLMEYGKRYPNGIEVSEGIAKSTINGNITGWTMSAILVNAEGNRVVNEKASNRTILETELKQTNSMLYLLLDEETFQVWRQKLSEAGISQENIDSYLANNGTTTPIFAHADTLEDLAKIVNMDAETLKATVEKYNQAVESGKDELGRQPEYMTMKIGAGPYYLVEQKPRFATTMGGLVVNELLEVKNTQGTVISGLYAAGEVVGGVMGDDSPSGANNGWAVTSGKLAAEAIAEAIK